MLCPVCTYYAVGHQGSLHKACQDISRVMLVVGDTRQASVKGHHQQGKLEQRAEETCAAPCKPGLEIKLEREGEKGVDKENT